MVIHPLLFAKSQSHQNEGEHDGLPIPPRPHWIGYGNDFGDKGAEWYISKGKSNTDQMMDIVAAGGFSPAQGGRILELGCAAGRMIRHLKRFTSSCEIWGVDISAWLVNWCNVNLSPPFHFATTTTIPHLPFADDYFDLIYTGSVFTHIDDLADAWLLEIRRLLKPNGLAYITIHDRHTIDLVNAGYHYDPTGYFANKDRIETELRNAVNSNPVYQKQKNDFGMLVIDRNSNLNVFYNVEFFKKMVENCLYKIVSITEEAYSYQTAVLLKK